MTASSNDSVSSTALNPSPSSRLEAELPSLAVAKKAVDVGDNCLESPATIDCFPLSIDVIASYGTI